jgi:hypothetical protein
MTERTLPGHLRKENTWSCPNLEEDIMYLAEGDREKEKELRKAYLAGISFLLRIIIKAYR